VNPTEALRAAPESDPLKADVNAAWPRLSQEQREHFAAAMKAAAKSNANTDTE
jgi:hypothetical protein